MTIRTWGLALVLMLTGWVGVQAVVMRVSDVAPGAIALFPRPDFVSQLPEDVALVGAGRFWYLVRSDASDLGRTLYLAGARLVLPAGLPGCLPLPEA